MITIENKVSKLKLDKELTEESIKEILTDISTLYGNKAVGNYKIGEVVACASNSVENLDIYIHSAGGSVFDGYRLFSAITELRARGVYVTAIIDSLAASMASVVCCACDKVLMTKHSKYMIHEASTSGYGNSADFAKASEFLDSISTEIANIYVDRTGLTYDTVRAMMKEETWMNAEKAIDLKFADGLYETKKDESENKTSIFDTATNLMSIFDKFKPDAALVEKVTGLEASLLNTENMLAELTASFDERGASLQNAVTELNELKETFRVANEELSKVKAEADSKAQIISNLTEELEQAKQSAHNRAIDIVAQAGHSVVETTDISDTKALTREAINAIPDAAERSKARLKNWKKLNQ